MIRELIERFKAWVQHAREAAAALKEKFAAAVRSIKPTPPDVACAIAIVVASDGNVLNAGKRYRLTSGHAPVSSYSCSFHAIPRNLINRSPFFPSIPFCLN